MSWQCRHVQFSKMDVTCQSDFTSHSSSLFQRQGRNSVRLMHLWSGWNVPRQSCGVHVYPCQTGRSFWRGCRKILMGRQYIFHELPGTRLTALWPSRLRWWSHPALQPISVHPDRMVFADRIIRIHREIPFSWMTGLVSVWVRLAYWSFSTMSSLTLWLESLVQVLGIGLCLFPFRCLLEFCQLSYLYYWRLCLTRFVPVCCVLCRPLLHEVGCGKLIQHWSMPRPVILHLWEPRLNALYCLWVVGCVGRSHVLTRYCTTSGCGLCRWEPRFNPLLYYLWLWVVSVRQTLTRYSGCLAVVCRSES